MYYYLNTQRLVDSNNQLVRDFSNSRVLNRLNTQEQISEVKKFCSFRFAVCPAVLVG